MLSFSTDNPLLIERPPGTRHLLHRNSTLWVYNTMLLQHKHENPVIYILTTIQVSTTLKFVLEHDIPVSPRWRAYLDSFYLQVQPCPQFLQRKSICQAHLVQEVCRCGPVQLTALQDLYGRWTKGYYGCFICTVFTSLLQQIQFTLHRSYLQSTLHLVQTCYLISFSFMSFIQ